MVNGTSDRELIAYVRGMIEHGLTGDQRKQLRDLIDAHLADPVLITINRPPQS